MHDATSCLHYIAQDRAIQEELDNLARNPDSLRRYVKYKTVDTAFRLWDLDGNGKVLREKITRGLLRCAPWVSDLCWCKRGCTCVKKSMQHLPYFQSLPLLELHH